uniref:Candidate secreted effector n=1 Tax=Meloidogyne incognita TaxID=6306 RepID=A0A914KHN6_MELIC
MKRPPPKSSRSSLVESAHISTHIHRLNCCAIPSDLQYLLNSISLYPYTGTQLMSKQGGLNRSTQKDCTEPSSLYSLSVPIILHLKIF